MGFEIFLLVIAAILIFCVVSSKIMYKFGVPILLLFMLIGILLGQMKVGEYFKNPDLIQNTGTIALNLILFSGGLFTRWKSLRTVVKPGILLATVGVVLTTLCTGVFCFFVLKVGMLEAMIIGAVVGSTDASAVFSILRSKNMNLKNNLAPLLELESGANDPFAYLMAMIFIGALTAGSLNGWSVAWLVVRQLTIGIGFGVLFGWLSGKIINKLKLSSDGLYLIFVLALELLLFAGVDILGGNGFLASYIFAIILGNSHFVKKLSVIKFFEAISWLMQIILFILLGIQIVPSSLLTLALPAIAVAVLMIFVGRPLVVFLLLSFFPKYNWRDKIFVSWVGFRGGSSIVFAAFPLVVFAASNAHFSNLVFNMVFFICIISILLQGTFTPLLAKWLKVSEPQNDAVSLRTFNDYVDERHNVLAEIKVNKKSFVVGRSIIEMGLPRNVLIIMIFRQGKYVTPMGHTEIEAGDMLTVTANSEEELELVNALLGREGIPEYEGIAGEMSHEQRIEEGIVDKWAQINSTKEIEQVYETQTQLSDEMEDDSFTDGKTSPGDEMEIPTFEMLTDDSGDEDEHIK